MKFAIAKDMNSRGFMYNRLIILREIKIGINIVGKKGKDHE